MTPNPLRELARLRREATAGPWRLGSWGGQCAVNHFPHGGKECFYEPELRRTDDYHVIAGAEPRGDWDAGNVVGAFDYEEGGVIREPDAAYIAAAGSVSAEYLEAVARTLETARAVISSPLHTRELEPTVVFDKFRSALAALDAATRQEVAGEAE